MSKKKGFTIKRIATDALLAAMFFALSLLSVKIGGLKFTFVGITAVISSMLFGMKDALAVAAVGAFLEQVVGYGIAPTTVLWLLPAMARAFVISLGIIIFKKQMSIDYVTKQKRPFVYFAVCIIAGIATSLVNTLIYYVDSKLLGYYSYALVFGVLGERIITGVIASIITALAAIPIIAALKKAGFTER